MKKFKIFFDIEKEEKWLNAMLQKGWLCTHANTFGFYYTFQKTADIDQVIRIDHQNGLKKEARQNYLQLHEDFGWRTIKTNVSTSTYYWVKRKDGRDDLFSDDYSQIAKYKRFMKSSATWAVIFFVYSMFFNTSDNFPVFFDLKSAYLTPGLWDKEGNSFLFAFLFETPFALMRIIPSWLFITLSVVYGLTYMRYRKAIQHLSS